MKILITNYGNRLNKGTAALLHSQIGALKIRFPETEFWVFTYYPKLENYLKEDYVQFFEILGKFSKRHFLKNLKTLNVLLWCLLWRFFNFFGLNLKLTGDLRKYYLADMIINTGGDGLTEDYGTPLNVVINLIFGIILRKKVVIYAESIGSFKKWYNRLMVKFLLERISLISLREEISIKNLKSLKIRKEFFLVADPAFLLESAQSGRIAEMLAKEKIKKPFVGFSVSKLFSRYKFKSFSKKRYDNYLRVTAGLVDYLTLTKNINVVFIPHVVEQNNDDRLVAEELMSLVSDKSKVLSVETEYSPEELKGIIGESEIFIGSRMHSCIASSSMLVPTVAIAYSHKTAGIIGKMLKYEDFVIDFNDITLERLIVATSKALEEKQKIKKDLGEKIKKIKENSMVTVDLIGKIL